MVPTFRSSATVIQESTSLQASQALHFLLSGYRCDLVKFMLWSVIICCSLFRHSSCSRRCRIKTESGSWTSCKIERRVDVFPRRFKSWRSPRSLPRGQRNRAQRRRRRRARPRMLGMFRLRRQSALSPTAAAAAAVLRASYLRETRQLQRAHTQKSE